MSYQAGDISLIELLNNEIAALYMSEQCSDITLYIEDQKIPVHRSIIGARCEYLKTYFSNGLNEPKQTEFKLNVPLEAFHVLLKYFYTGQMSLSKITNIETLIQILNLVEEYCLFYLKMHFENYFKQIISIENALRLLEVAKLYEFKELEIESINIIDANADQILASESLKKIHKNLLEEILTRNTFNTSSELFKLHAVEEWSKQANENIETVLHLVKLFLIPLEELIRIRKSGTINAEMLFDTIEKQMATKSTPSSDIQSIGQLPEPNENVASFKYKVQGLEGCFANYKYSNVFEYRHMVGDGSCIKFKLGHIFIINHLKIVLESSYKKSYFIEISTDQKKWERIIDYSFYDCRSTQNLFFSAKPVQYVKIIGTSPVKEYFHIERFEAYYREIISEIRNGIVVPKKKVYCQVWWEDWCEQIDCQVWGEDWCVQMDQPYYISSISFEIEENENIKYKFIIKTSLNNEDWEEVAERDEFVSGLQSFQFTSKPIVYFKIFVTACNTHGELNKLQINCFECPSSIECADIF